METGALIAFLAGAVAISIALLGADRGAGLVGGLFSPPVLGWPAGIQEDDDATWDWRTAPRAAATGLGDPRRSAGPVPPTLPQRRLPASRW